MFPSRKIPGTLHYIKSYESLQRNSLQSQSFSNSKWIKKDNRSTTQVNTYNLKCCKRRKKKEVYENQTGCL